MFTLEKLYQTDRYAGGPGFETVGLAGNGGFQGEVSHKFVVT